MLQTALLRDQTTLRTPVRFSWRLALLAAASAFLALPAALAANEQANMTMIDPGAIQWSDAPPSMPKGAKLAVLSGDPSKEGPFVMRLKTPANYRIAPHTHSQAEQLTVISGTLYLGMGEKVDKAQEHALKAGGFHSLPAKTPHYAFTKVPTVVQVNGNGPFDIIYLSPADNPDQSKKQ
ncbi:cupin domain-containing protein [Variovorax soli]|uniref:Quercetin dioxygenase-like cupin family protein n=1 Tax=Variovorax soli TaxID=376815 RepID=A0ABU1NCY2_9BURK|nr:cupin domain-containing protein [Variovorax soli]MDR6536294.1 quercetin dioxygenase-like cupin family protein [Variovorax soli]